MKYLMTVILIILVNTSSVNADIEQSSGDYAKLSFEFQNIVRCITYADTPQHRKKLLMLAPKAISVGRKFVSAAIDRKIEAADWTSYVPMEYRLRIQGPTADFVVGRLWEFTKTKALSSIFQTCEVCASSEKLLHIKMNLSFDKHQCDALI